MRLIEIGVLNTARPELWYHENERTGRRDKLKSDNA
jgi:hypothetical protein